MEANTIFKTADDRDYVLRLAKESGEYPEDVIAKLLQQGYKLPISIPEAERKQL